MSYRNGLLAGVAFAACALSSVGSRAADIISPTASPLYISVFGGTSFLNDVRSLGSTGAPQPVYATRTDAGYLLGAAIGTHLGESFRPEVELSYSRWGINALSNSGGGFSPASGNFAATYLLGNIWYDFKNTSAFTPYIGGGAGVAMPSQHLIYKTTDDYSDTPVTFAFQLGLGAKVALSDQIDLDIGYRFKDVPNFNLNLAGFNYYNYQLISHNIQAGLTFHF